MMYANSRRGFFQVRQQLSWILNQSQTTATRFWFGLASIGMGVFMLNSPTVHNSLSEYQMMLKLAPDYIWASAFIINGLSLWYGVFTRTYNKLLVILEGLLGTIAWTTSAVAVVITQQSFGAHVAGAAIALWLLVRYPTHREYKDGT